MNEQATTKDITTKDTTVVVGQTNNGEKKYLRKPRAFVTDVYSWQHNRIFGVSNVKIFPARQSENSIIRAYVEVTFSGALRIYGVKVLESDGRPYVVWPRYQIGDKQYKPVRILSKSLRHAIENYILDEYKKGHFTIKQKNEQNEGNSATKKVTPPDAQES